MDEGGVRVQKRLAGCFFLGREGKMPGRNVEEVRKGKWSFVERAREDMTERGRDTEMEKERKQEEVEVILDDVLYIVSVASTQMWEKLKRQGD